MNYISLFSGIGGFELAIHKVFPNAKCVGYVEIDNNAKKVYRKTFPYHPLIANDIFDVKSLPECDLIVGGPPCQDFSTAKINKTGKGLEIFKHTVNLIKQTKPKYLIIENTGRISKVNLKLLNDLISIDNITLNSNKFSAQNRKRNFWTNFPIVLPINEDKTKVKDILEPPENVANLAHSQAGIDLLIRPKKRNVGGYPGSPRLFCFGTHVEDEKSKAVVASFKKGVPWNALQDNRIDGKSVTLTLLVNGRQTNGVLRKWHPHELERLQGFPIGYTDDINYTRRVGLLGNAVTVPVVEYLLRNLHIYINQVDVH